MDSCHLRDEICSKTFRRFQFFQIFGTQFSLKTRQCTGVGFGPDRQASSGREYDSRMTTSMDSEVTGFETQFCHMSSQWPWIISLIVLSLGFPFNEREKIILRYLIGL